MDISKYYSPEYSPELKDFLAEYFLYSENNDGYRYFPKESIKIDYDSKTVTFLCKKAEVNMGADSLASRVQADTQFNGGLNLSFLRGFGFEEKMFNGTVTTWETEKAKNHQIPEIGGKAVITQTALYLDKLGELYIGIPLSRPEETYGASGKLTGASMIHGSASINTDRILKSTNPVNTGGKGTNSLFRIQKRFEREKIVDCIEDFDFGDWTVVFQLENSSYQKIDNVHIGRANDGAFEILTSKLFYSYEDLASHYDIQENLGFVRPVGLVKVSDLLMNENGSDLAVQKLFYNNSEIKAGDDIPQGFESVIERSDAGFVFTQLNHTPPLKQFIGRAKVLLFSEEFKGTLQAILDNMKRRGGDKSFDELRQITTEERRGERSMKQASKQGTQKGADIDEAGVDSEDNFGDKFSLAKNEKIQKMKLTIPENFRGIIDNTPNLADDKKKQLINCINGKYGVGEYTVELDPDFILKGSDGSDIFIEYKRTKNALSKSQSKNQTMRAHIVNLFSDTPVIYTTIVGGGYGIDYMQIFTGISRISERYIDEQLESEEISLPEFLKQQKDR